MRRHLITAAVLAALAGLTACGTAGNGGEPTETPASTAADTAASASPTSGRASTETGIDPRLEVLVGTWEADPEEVGPHGSTLTVEEDGTATLLSFANQHGAYEGAIVLGDAEPHRFEGIEPETGDEIVLDLEFDADADTLAVTYPGGETYVHTRA